MSDYSEEETMEWCAMVGLAVCGAPVIVGRNAVTYACQREPGHDGPHDPR